MAGFRVAVVGSPLSHGGQVTEGSPKHRAGGKAVARVGDKVMCELHGEQTITSGAAKHRVDGKACARVTSACSCGATITDGSPKYRCD